ncbi:MAG: hypothetical protein Q9167_005573 [Letrouitia subvulpina]
MHQILVDHLLLASTSPSLSRRMATQASRRHRKERRAQPEAKNMQAEDIPLARPPQTPPKGKTLIEIAKERQLLQDPDDTTLSTADDTASVHLDILLYFISLTLLHFTLTFLVHHQYATDRPSLWPLFLSTTVFSPAPWLILLLVAVLHPNAGHLALQLGFAVFSVIAGGWLVYACNEDSYLAVMMKAPPLGTLWVWSIVELRLETSVCCLLLTGVWAWWKGYGFWS